MECSRSHNHIITLYCINDHDCTLHKSSTLNKYYIDIYIIRLSLSKYYDVINNNYLR